MATGKSVIFPLFYSLLCIRPISGSSGTAAAKCVLPKLGFFDCGDGDCISSDLVCDGRIDCLKSGKDESDDDCRDHFRRRCILDSGDFLIDLDNLTNFYLGYNVISGLSGPILDRRYVDNRVNNEASDCRRVEYESDEESDHPPTTKIDNRSPSSISSSGSRPGLLPYNVDIFKYRSPSSVAASGSIKFESSVFNTPYEGFIDLKRRKSIVVIDNSAGDQSSSASSKFYDHQLRSITLSQAYQQHQIDTMITTTAMIDQNHRSSYWSDESEFWQSNTPFVRFYAEKVIGEFRLKPNYRLAFNPEFLEVFNEAIISVGNSTTGDKDNVTWWNLFDRFGTHYPIGGTIGGSIEILARRKSCPTTKSHESLSSSSSSKSSNISMSEIEKCLSAQIDHLAADEEEVKWHCGRLKKKLSLPESSSLSDAIDWTYRKVIGGGDIDQIDRYLGPRDELLDYGRVENWTRTIVPETARPLSTDLSAICDLIDRFVLSEIVIDDNLVGPAEDRDVNREELANRVKISCQREIVAYVRQNDLLNVRKPGMIPCREDAVPIWRFVETSVDKKLVLRGLPWCLSRNNTGGSCPASVTSTRVFRAALATANNGGEAGNSNSNSAGQPAGNGGKMPPMIVVIWMMVMINFGVWFG